MSGRAKRPAARVLLGEIAGAHGIRGAVVIRAYAATPEGLSAYGPLENEQGTRRFTVSVERETAKGVIARIEGVTDRTGAEALEGEKLYVARDRLPETADGEYYHVDLIGLAAIDETGAPVGEVVSVENYGAGDLLEIRLAGGSATELLAMTDAFVRRVDLAAGIVVVAMPETGRGEEESGD